MKSRCSFFVPFFPSLDKPTFTTSLLSSLSSNVLFPPFMTLSIHCATLGLLPFHLGCRMKSLTSKTCCFLEYSRRHRSLANPCQAQFHPPLTHHHTDRSHTQSAPGVLWLAGETYPSAGELLSCCRQDSRLEVVLVGYSLDEQ